MSMTPLFSPEGEQALRELVASRPLLAFDFDGTLAPIVDDPTAAAIPPQTLALLQQLASRFEVAIVSGRAAADVSSRLGFKPAYVLGNHGAEEGDAPLPEHARPAVDALHARVAAAGAALAQAGVEFEDKGHSWTLHYRRAPDEARARREIEQLLSGLPAPLVTMEGKCCVNLLIAGAPDKGQALAALMARQGHGTVLYAGDDVTDESVYRCARPGWLTVHVGHRVLAHEARYCVERQADVARLLARLCELSA